MPGDLKKTKPNYLPKVLRGNQSGLFAPSLSRPGTWQEVGDIQVGTPILGSIHRFKAYQAAKITTIQITVFIVVFPQEPTVPDQWAQENPPLEGPQLEGAGMPLNPPLPLEKAERTRILFSLRQ